MDTMPKTEAATREALAQAKLTDLQRAFVVAYLGAARFNATEAARRAGYNGTYGSIRAIASQNLKKPEIGRVVEIHFTAWRAESEEKERARRTAIMNSGRKARRPWWER